MEQLAFTQFLNHLFGAQVLALLQALHFNPNIPLAPISNSFAMEVLVFLFLTLFFLAARMRLSVDSPGALQHVVEGIEGFVGDMGEEVIGHHYKQFAPYLVALGLFHSGART